MTVSPWIHPLRFILQSNCKGGTPPLQVDGKMHLRGWIQGLTVTVGAVSQWIQGSMDPWIQLPIYTQVYQLISKGLVLETQLDIVWRNSKSQSSSLLNVVLETFRITWGSVNVMRFTFQLHWRALPPLNKYNMAKCITSTLSQVILKVLNQFS